jgi:hypothetical protein
VTESRNLESTESGQAAISLILILGLFLLGVFGLAVDFTNMWFHRQAATAAADAACQAGAMDMLATAGGMTLPATGFTPGSASDCISNSSATMCSYAAANGYNGTGLNAGAASNSVSWTFPSSVTGVTPGAGSYPFIKLSISENVKTYFVGLLNASRYQTVNATCTCGIVQVKAAAPVVVLHPTMSGAFNYSGGGSLYIVGGPQRSLQVNSSSATAVLWSASGMIDLSKGGPNVTGSDVAVTGGPSQIPGSGTCNSNSGFCGGTTGSWKGRVLPVPDPYGNVPSPKVPANAPASKWVDYGVDNCPDHRLVYQYYDSVAGKSVYKSCVEYSPGYYPSGINLSGTTTAIFLPGIYYMNGSLNASASATVRMAKPAGYYPTDGVMFYFSGGSLNFSGCSGCADTSNIDNVDSGDLTCDQQTPIPALNMPTSIPGNVLIAQCARDGTYWDGVGSTTDVRGTPGIRGLLVFQAHNNTTQPQFSGSGSLTYSGALYFHSTGYQDVLSLSGGASSGTFILGEIVADQINLSGTGVIRLALNPLATTNSSKVAILQ